MFHGGREYFPGIGFVEIVESEDATGVVYTEYSSDTCKYKCEQNYGSIYISQKDGIL